VLGRVFSGSSAVKNFSDSHDADWPITLAAMADYKNRPKRRFERQSFLRELLPKKTFAARSAA